MSKKYTQPSTSVVPGGMILDEMRDAEEQVKLDEATKEANLKEFDKWLNKLVKKNGTTKY